jgi:hypothetical protein
MAWCLVKQTDNFIFSLPTGQEAGWAPEPVSKYVKGTCKVVLVFDYVTHNEDTLCLTKHHSVKTYGVVEV